MSRMTLTPNSSCLPSPPTNTRGEGTRPRLWTSVTSPLLPLISPSEMSALIPPPSALSTAPVAPPGFFTPWKRLTMIAFAECWVMSPDSTLISTAILLVVDSFSGTKMIARVVAGGQR